MSAPDDELQKIFKRNREEIKQNIEDLWHKEVFRPLFLIDAPLPSSNTQKVIVPTPSGTQVVDTEQPIENFQNFKPGQSFRDFLIENNGKLIVEADEKKAISSQRDLSLEKKVWQQKIQPISDHCLNGEFQYDPCLGVAELTDDSIALVHNKIFQIFNKLIDFPSQLTQMAPPIDQGRQAKELVLAFDDIVLKKLRAGLGTPEKHELFFDFLQDVYDCNLLPAFLTYLGHFIGVSYNSKECPDGSLTDLPPQKKSKLKINDDQDNTIDDFIKDITIRYENDSQISIQQKGKPKMNVEMTALNFKEGGSKVTWNNFLAVLKDSPRHYWEVPDRPLNQLKTINERLITGLSKICEVQFPEKYKLYRRNKIAGPGVYKFTFNIKYEETDPVQKKSIRKEFFTLSEEYKNVIHSKVDQNKRARLEDKISDIAEQGLKSGVLSDQEIKSALTPTKEKVDWETKTQEAAYLEINEPGRRKSEQNKND